MTRLRFFVSAAALLLAACGGSGSATTATTSTTVPEGPGAAYAGAWFGLVPPGYRVQVQFEVSPNGRLTGVFDSIDEGVMGLPLGYVSVTGDGVTFTVADTPMSGTFAFDDQGRLAGTFDAEGEGEAVVLVRRDPPFAFDRPQEPSPPFPYTAEDVTFPGGNGAYDLAGTITIPDGEGPFPAVLLISGSGPQDRDEQLAGHRPFLVLADHLTRAGIAVLRYDDPGYLESGGSMDGTTADLADDAAAAFRYLEDRTETATTGLLGHSEGGLIAPMVAAAEPGTAFIVLLAGPATPGAQVLAEQTALIMAAEGAPADVTDWQVAFTEEAIAAAASDLDDTALEAELLRIASDYAVDAPAVLAGQVSTESLHDALGPYLEPWMRFFLAYDPGPALEALDIPVLALFGSVDLQVPAATNAGPMEHLLGHPGSEVETIAGVNHLFQHSETGRVSEYADLDETMSPGVLERVTAWILSVAG